MCTLLLLLTHWMRVKDVFARTADETMATETAANGAKGLVSTRRKKQLIRTMHCIVQEYNMEQCGTKCKVHRRLLLDSRLKRSATASPTTTKPGANRATPTWQPGHHSQPGEARNRPNQATGQDRQPGNPRNARNSASCHPIWLKPVPNWDNFRRLIDLAWFQGRFITKKLRKIHFSLRVPRRIPPGGPLVKSRFFCFLLMNRP